MKDEYHALIEHRTWDYLHCQPNPILFLKWPLKHNMVSVPPQDPLDHLLSDFRYRITHHLYPRSRCLVLTWECVLKESHIR